MQAILIEDEAALRLATTQSLQLGGFSVSAFVNAEQAQAHIGPEFDGVIVSDVRLPGMSGIGLLGVVKAIDAELPVILVTGHGDVGMAVEAMRNGAYDFIEKPFGAERLLSTVKRAQERRSLVLENRRLKAAFALHPDTPSLVGRSAGIEQVKLMVLDIVPRSAGEAAAQLTGNGVALPEMLDRHERGLIVSALAAAAGNVAQAAEQLGIPRKTLYDKIKKYQLAPGRVGQ